MTEIADTTWCDARHRHRQQLIAKKRFTKLTDEEQTTLDDLHRALADHMSVTLSPEAFLDRCIQSLGIPPSLVHVGGSPNLAQAKVCDINRRETNREEEDNG